MRFSKQAFLKYELGILTIKAALSTRNQEYPIYAADQNTYRREALRTFRSILVEIEDTYTSTKVEEPEHIQFISEAAERISEELGSRLYKQRLRIGVAQKLINLHLKYLWVAGLIREPPHCPLDGIVRDRAGLRYDWISNDSIADYERAIEQLKKTASPESLAVWELEAFRRRGQ